MPVHLAMTDAIGEAAERKGDADVLDHATAPGLASSAPPLERARDSIAMLVEQPPSSVADGDLHPRPAEENKDTKAEEKKGYVPTASRAGAYADLNAVYLAWERHCAQARVALETWCVTIGYTYYILTYE